MSKIEYIAENLFIVKRYEGYGYVKNVYEYDETVLKLLDKKYNICNDDLGPPEVIYTFKVLQCKPTKINFIAIYDTKNKDIECVNININDNFRVCKCIIL